MPAASVLGCTYEGRFKVKVVPREQYRVLELQKYVPMPGHARGGPVAADAAMKDRRGDNGTNGE